MSLKLRKIFYFYLFIKSTKEIHQIKIIFQYTNWKKRGTFVVFLIYLLLCENSCFVRNFLVFFFNIPHWTPDGEPSPT